MNHYVDLILKAVIAANLCFASYQLVQLTSEVNNVYGELSMIEIHVGDMK